MNAETSVATAPAANQRFAPIDAVARLKDKRWNEVIDDAQRFVKELEKLRDDNRGAFSSLRRNAGSTLGEARGAAWIHARLHGMRRIHEEKYFLIATLFDLNRHRAIGGDMGTTLRLLQGKSSAEAVERRFLVLLDAEFGRVYDAQDGGKSGGGEMAFRLRQMVKLAGAREIGINWAVLLADLCCWDLPDKRVQKKWARNFYDAATSTSDATKEEKTDVN